LKILSYACAGEACVKLDCCWFSSKSLPL